MDDVGFLTALARYHFLQQALIAGLLVGTTCAALSVFVVLKQLAFMGQGISHAAFGGIGLGLLLAPGIAAPTVGVQVATTVFCVSIALVIGVVSRHSQVGADTAIGVLLAFSMALGLIFLALREAYTPELMSFLFGSILGVRRLDLVLIAVVALLTAGTVLPLSKEWRYFLFDEHMAGASGLPTGAMYYALLVLMALVIVVSIKVVGIILVSAFLVIPGATGLLVAQRLRHLILVAQAVSLLSVLVGLWASYRFAWPTGATIVVTQSVCFGAAWLVRRGPAAGIS